MGDGRAADGDVDELLAEQVRYYRARAPQYDDWWLRRGRYGRSPVFEAAWLAEIETVEQWLDEQAPLGRVLELAAGTGNLTHKLAARTDRVTAVDSSPETLAINASKLDERGLAERVEIVEADVFAFAVDEPVDTIAMGFWLTHVPETRFEAFWQQVGANLAPGGQVLVLDNAHPERTSSIEGSPVQLAGDRVHTLEGDVDLPAGTARRNLVDGREFDIVKIYWRPAEIEARLDGLGWDAEFATTDHFFLHGRATPR